MAAARSAARVVAGRSPPNVSLAISAMPPMAPMTLAASTGSISTFWFGDRASPSSALM